MTATGTVAAEAMMTMGGAKNNNQLKSKSCRDRSSNNGSGRGSRIQQQRTRQLPNNNIMCTMGYKN
jgi:hypothetical protein